MPGNTIGSLRLWVDSADNTLYALGIINANDSVPNNYGEMVIPRYRDGAWSILHGFIGVVSDAIRFGDTLLVGGALSGIIRQGIDTLPVSCIAAYYDESWHPYGDFGTANLVRRLKVLNGELYAIGSFRYAEGQECNGVAKRVGGQWVPVGQLQVVPPSSTPNLLDAIIYQGDLYVTGVINLAPNGANGIARFDGQGWSAPGGGILGGFANGSAMAIYQDELILGGTIYITAGNPGHMIQRWNGSEWRAVGGHLTNTNNNFSSAARCDALFVYEDKLLAAGGFQHAGGVPAQTFAIWDGTAWCGTGDAISNTSHSIALYNDTIYLASGRVVNGDSTNTVVKWVSGAMQGSVCSEVSVAEMEAGNVFSLFPNPARNSVTLSSHSSRSTSFTVFDALGRMMEQGSARPNEQVKLLLEGWTPGIYHVHWSAGEWPRAASRFVKE